MRDIYKNLITAIEDRDLLPLRKHFRTMSEYHLENLKDVSSNKFVNQRDILNFHTLSYIIEEVTGYQDELSEVEYKYLHGIAQTASHSLTRLTDAYQEREKCLLELDIIATVVAEGSDIETLLINEDFSITVQTIFKDEKSYNDFTAFASEYDLYDYLSLKTRYSDFIYEFKENPTIQDLAQTTSVLEDSSMLQNISFEQFEAIFKDMQIIQDSKLVDKESLYYDLLDKGALPLIPYIIHNIENVDIKGMEVISTPQNNKENSLLSQEIHNLQTGEERVRTERL